MANHNPVLEVTNIKIHIPVSYARNENCELFSLLISSFPIPVLIGFFVHLCRKSHRIKWTHKWAYNRKSSIIGFAHCLKKSKEMCNELNNSQLAKYARLARVYALTINEIVFPFYHYSLNSYHWWLLKGIIIQLKVFITKEVSNYNINAVSLHLIDR